MTEFIIKIIEFAYICVAFIVWSLSIIDLKQGVLDELERLEKIKMQLSEISKGEQK